MSYNLVVLVESMQGKRALGELPLTIILSAAASYFPSTRRWQQARAVTLAAPDGLGERTLRISPAWLGVNQMMSLPAF